jgi:uroporphyrinogen-III synthase
MRLLVTRPEPEASDLARTLTGMGHQVIVQPLVRMEPNPEPAGLPQPSAIVVTSRNGVRALVGWQVSQSWRGTRIYAVGTATAEAAGDAGFTDVRAGGGDVTALAELIRDDFDRTGGMILYPAARDRSADLAALLPGYAVRTVEAYRAEAVAAFDRPALEALRGGGLDGVLLFSRRTAQTFARLVTEAGVRAGLTGVRLYCLSAQVAEPVAGLAGGILIAADPHENALLALLDPALAGGS